MITPDQFSKINAAIPLVQGNTCRLASSSALGWRGILVEVHRAEPVERAETAIAYHLVELAFGRRIVHGERADLHGRFKPYSKYPGMLNLYDRVFPAIRPLDQAELILCALDPAFVKQIALELDRPSPMLDHGKLGFRDEAIASLMRLLAYEAKLRRASERLYIDSLTYALTIRLLSLEANRDAWRVHHALPDRALRRTLDKMETECSSDITLESLALESGYSTNHFLQMFRASTGSTPYQYLLNLRIKRAQSMMNHKSMQLLDIALECGFSSHAQFSRMFRKILGMTPSQYRRSLR